MQHSPPLIPAIHVLGIRRDFEDTHFVGLFNFSAEQETVPLTEEYTDLLQPGQLTGRSVNLLPYDFRWLKLAQEGRT